MKTFATIFLLIVGTYALLTGLPVQPREAVFIIWGGLWVSAVGTWARSLLFES